MILLYKDLQQRGLSDYKIKKKLANRELYMVMKGLYSTTENYDYLECITKKHPNTIVTLETACICYSLLKKPSNIYYVATKQKDRKINDKKVKQIFMTDSLYEVGVNVITYQHYNIRIYDLERLLIEVVRNKTNIDFDTYKEIMNSYKRISKLLNKKKLDYYLTLFKDKRIKARIDNEIFAGNSRKSGSN